MKKMFYVLFIAIAASLAITSCTEETIAPAAENGGGGAYDPK